MKDRCVTFKLHSYRYIFVDETYILFEPWLKCKYFVTQYIKRMLVRFLKYFCDHVYYHIVNEIDNDPVTDLMTKGRYKTGYRS